MADEPSWDDIFTSQPSPTAAETRPAPQNRREARESSGRREARESSGRRVTRTTAETPIRHERARRGGDRVDEHGLPPKRRRRLTWLWVLISIVVLLGGASAAVFFTFEPQIKQVLGWAEPIDYTGSGTGKIVVTITNGQIGSDVAKTLASAEVTKTYTAFYKLLLKQDPQVQFHPGSYQLKKQMSAKAALAALLDPKSQVSTRLVLPEGITVKGVIKRLADLSESTGISGAQLEAAAADYKSFGLPAEAPSLEGYLFPATYSIEPGQTAHAVLQTLVTTMFQHLDADGVAPADRHKILTLAALTQKEGGSSADFFKVARVWDNRLATGMPLQSDATVSYGSGGTTISTTDAQRADKGNPYNTYAHTGLPIGPISNPGDDAIKATLHPADGTWLFFVLVNGETGETVFSTTLAEHNAAVKQWQAWLRAHPGFDG
ncbi:endolytic transglycosylase MltG [Lacisediminihabitans sp.]|uniref:endolytic transglycosylase MltG n=1 Tax=Lacisediminihabitans sp. TaxID=2787631 RepID=UPI002F922714